MPTDGNIAKNELLQISFQDSAYILEAPILFGKHPWIAASESINLTYVYVYICVYLYINIPIHIHY